MGNIQWLNNTIEFIFIVNTNTGTAEKSYYNDGNNQIEITEKLSINSTITYDDGATKDDRTLNILMTTQIKEDEDTLVDTFIISLYGRSGTGEFLLSSTKLGPKARVTTSYSGECASIPSALFITPGSTSATPN